MGAAGLSTWCCGPWHVVLQALAYVLQAREEEEERARHEEKERRDAWWAA